jgi:hypothetical protein
MSHIGHPLVGDATYGGRRRASGTALGPAAALVDAFPRQALHAAPDNKDCQEAVALACEAMLHLPPDNPKRAPGADLISLRQRAAGIKAKPTRKPAKAKPRRKS